MTNEDKKLIADYMGWKIEATTTSFGHYHRTIITPGFLPERFIIHFDLNYSPFTPASAFSPPNPSDNFPIIPPTFFQMFAAITDAPCYVCF